MSTRAAGRLWESAILVEVLDGKRVPTLQVVLSRLRDDRWEVFGQELPRGSGRQAFTLPTYTHLMQSSQGRARRTIDKLLDGPGGHDRPETARRRV